MDWQHPSSFGALLHGYREAARLTQEELAERAGLTAKGISALERGERRRPYRDTVGRLVAALGLEGSDRAAFESSARGREIQAAGEDAAPAAAPPLVGRARERMLLERHLADSGPPVPSRPGNRGSGRPGCWTRSRRWRGEAAGPSCGAAAGCPAASSRSRR